MARRNIAYVARTEPDATLVEQQLTGLEYQMDIHVCNSEGEIIEAVKGADVVINQAVPMPRRVIDAIDTAQAIVNFGHGFDRIDHNAATEKGIMVVNSAGFCSEEVSNHVIMLVLACAKRLTSLNTLVKNGRWDTETRGGLWDLDPVDGQTLGLVGFGNIGRAAARKAHVFGLEPITYDPYVPPWVVKEYRVEQVSTLEEIARRSDFVSMHVPLNDDTRGLAGEPFFKAMKPTAFFINTCRGPTVDEQALIRALQSGEIAGAGLDVFEQEPTPPDNPLLAMDNVIATPHTAGFSRVSSATSHVRVGQETARLLKDMWPMALVNPEVRSRIPDRQVAAG